MAIEKIIARSPNFFSLKKYFEIDYCYISKKHILFIFVKRKYSKTIFFLKINTIKTFPDVVTKCNTIITFIH